jgi:hypothetical protein
MFVLFAKFAPEKGPRETGDPLFTFTREVVWTALEVGFGRADSWGVSGDGGCDVPCERARFRRGLMWEGDPLWRDPAASTSAAAWRLAVG